MDKNIKFFELKELSEIPLKPADERIILCDKLNSVQVLSLCLNKTADHIVQKSNIFIQEELRFSASVLKSPEIFIKFPLSVIMGEENPTIKTESEVAELSIFLTVPTEKETVLEELENYVAQYCKRSSIVADIRTVGDEMLSNCLFNAPYVNAENTNSNVERNYDSISIDPTKKPQVFAGHDDSRVIIGCRDMYGQLNVHKLIERIRLCYVKNPGKMINFESGGAGIGSFMIFDSCMSFYLAVDPGKSTTLCCSFPTGMSAKQRDEVPKNVHIILNPEKK